MHWSNQAIYGLCDFSWFHMQISHKKHNWDLFSPVYHQMFFNDAPVCCFSRYCGKLYQAMMFKSSQKLAITTHTSLTRFLFCQGCNELHQLQCDAFFTHWIFFLFIIVNSKQFILVHDVRICTQYLSLKFKIRYIWWVTDVINISNQPIASWVREIVT